MIFSLIAFGGLVFWSILVLAALIILACVDERDYSIGLAGWTAFLVGAGIVAFVEPVAIDWTDALYYVAAYLGCGVYWATQRWYWTLQKIKRIVVSMQGRPESVVMDALRDRVNGSMRSFPPRPKEFSDSIWFWFMFWPFDLASKLVTRPLRWIFTRLINVFNHMRDRVIGDLKIEGEAKPGVVSDGKVTSV